MTLILNTQTIKSVYVIKKGAISSSFYFRLVNINQTLL